MSLSNIYLPKLLVQITRSDYYMGVSLNITDFFSFLSPNFVSSNKKGLSRIFAEFTKKQICELVSITYI